MNKNQNSKMTPLQFIFRVLQGALIGLGAVLPGISGGVLSVIFGIYKPIMELLSNPFKNFKTHVPKLIPVIIGGVIGFLGVANILSFFLEKYPDPSVCVFIGLITGMLPSLFREAGTQQRFLHLYGSMYVCYLYPAHRSSDDFHRSCPKFLLVSLLWILPGPQHNRTGNEFFYPSHASGSVYAFY